MLQLRRKRRWGAAHIGFEVGLAAFDGAGDPQRFGCGTALTRVIGPPTPQSCQRSGISVNAPAS